MSYQVLARKWRPQNFSELVGQEHIIRALSNALEQNRLHHAYLFTGTRGVGKTTIARILAKCLNCETKVAAMPCGQCSACQEITAGHFIDLIEVDAASKTKVEDTRELLDNVQYMPTRGRYKIYLIDEVHMLSGHSFNALLKTLEEPPEHIKFLLATTDPQRLPITVLSRCLQFNLKTLNPERIQVHLAHILTQEKIPYEDSALLQLAIAADGSVRDSLSLLDQAITFSDNHINDTAIREMLGNVQRTDVLPVFQALIDNNAQALLALTADFAQKAVDFYLLLEEMISSLHRCTIAQIAPESLPGAESALLTIAQQLSAEDVQLYYQIALIGRRDLPLAPNPRDGFEMIVLRMLAFTPSQPEKQSATRVNTTPKASAIPSTLASSPSSQISQAQSNNNNWSAVLPHLSLNGLERALANHCTLIDKNDAQWNLRLNTGQAPMLNATREKSIADALSIYLGKPTQLTITVGDTEKQSPAEQKIQQALDEKALAEKHMAEDNHMQAILETFDATLHPGSIQLNTSEEK